jgi:magnesium-transporting ATPase (P-type)
MIWYQTNIEELFDSLKTSEDGLSKSEVSERIKKYGENQLAIKKDFLLWNLQKNTQLHSHLF